ncbi:MAG TPA: NifU family protein [Terriglobales bacterium]|nr:NifU family protein [Terriglobales bacterium]
MENTEFQQHAERVEGLVQRASSIEDDTARTTALELMQSLMDLHGAGLTRIVEVLTNAGESGQNLIARLGNDPLICGLFVLYGIHPVPLNDRVTAAIESVAPQFRKQSASVQLLGIDDGVVRLAIHSTGNGCHSSPDALLNVVEQSIREAAPEVVEVRNEALTTSAFVPLTQLQSTPSEEKKYEESAA